MTAFSKCKARYLIMSRFRGPLLLSRVISWGPGCGLQKAVLASFPMSAVAYPSSSLFRTSLPAILTRLSEEFSPTGFPVCVLSRETYLGISTDYPYLTFCILLYLLLCRRFYEKPARIKELHLCGCYHSWPLFCISSQAHPSSEIT